MLTGVVEVGLFCHMARAAYFGNEVGFIFLELTNSYFRFMLTYY